MRFSIAIPAQRRAKLLSLSALNGYFCDEKKIFKLVYYSFLVLCWLTIFESYVAKIKFFRSFPCEVLLVWSVAPQEQKSKIFFI